ncbi:MAG: VWA domain-containing protein [Acidobacteriota bacterium]|nr:VWA domain-containing protein [Acidobacteriota bacterium]MDH3522169.1 VWA domain-containing protein [Acidobacteriota bacterium]
MRKTFLCCLLAGLAAAVGAAGVKDLPERYQDWLADVGPLISKAERKDFLALAQDYQRDAFVERFWAARDPRPETRQNEFRDRYYSRLEEARALYGGLFDDRARLYVLNGAPAATIETDCGVYTWPLELWRYPFSEVANRSVTAILYQPGAAGPFRLWLPAEGHAALLARIDPTLAPFAQRNAFYELVAKHCGELWDDIQVILTQFRMVESEQGAGATRAIGTPTSNDPEWTDSFHAFSTEVEEGAAVLPARLALAFPGPYQSRTRVQGTFTVPAAGARVTGEGETASYNFQLTGEVLRGEELFESFRYRFDVPSSRLQAEQIGLDFERALRPGDYRWVVKLEDLNGGAVHREERAVSVPRLAAEDAAPSAVSPASAGAVSISLGEPAAAVLSGAVRFTATVAGEGVAKVGFLLDGKPLFAKTRPPYSVELDLGSVPGEHTVRAVAYDAGGGELATDEMLVNPGKQSFVVRLVEPREGARTGRQLRARADVVVPEGERLDRLEFYVGNERAATLFQEPFVQSLVLADGGIGYIRVVAILENGGETEDWVIVNAPEFTARVEVRLVELYAAVLDERGLAVDGLGAGDFEVFENGAPQEIVRFDHLRDLPLYAGLMIDTSASMAESFEEVSRIGRGFLEETIGARDRAAIITFAEEPSLAAAFTSDLAVLGSALGGLRAERGTALWDSLVFAVDYFRGVKGQRALVLLSDGEDRRSGHGFEEALQFAQSTGITVYPIALAAGVRRSGKGQLTRLAEQTGGRSYFLRSIDELAEVYAQIQRDLRSRYLLAYQSTLTEGEGFRSIEIQVAGGDREVRALRGYFP